MTTVPLEQEKLAHGWRSPCSKKSRSESTLKSWLGLRRSFRLEMEQSIDNYLEGSIVKTIAQR